MNIGEFGQVWEGEYICSRVNRIIEAVKNGNYENALDYLAMIQDKAKAAEKFIKTETNNK
ncbi:hypothetical protein [Ruminiclostridium josui]|uniref:hypothetical protein n=1 Tax=Ruminiclostridium josui TaxID=1499 RepID=UPI0004675A8D|nr:hypothetical protein [Ruminiclostridium josui]